MSEGTSSTSKEGKIDLKAKGDMVLQLLDASTKLNVSAVGTVLLEKAVISGEDTLISGSMITQNAKF
jgi:hypothetical protein